MIIGIGGYKNVGKNTVADIFTKNYQFRQYAFADTIKRICSDITGKPLSLFEDNDKKDAPIKLDRFSCGLYLAEEVIQHLVVFYDKDQLPKEAEKKIKRACVGKRFNTPREMLQFVGTDLGRNCIDPEFWTNAFSMQVLGSKQPLIVPDVRFDNERSLIRRLGGKLILVERHNHGPGSHASERDMGSKDDYDFVIYNDSTEYALVRQVEGCYGAIEGKERA